MKVIACLEWVASWREAADGTHRRRFGLRSRLLLGENGDFGPL